MTEMTEGMVVLEHQGTPGMKGARKPLFPGGVRQRVGRDWGWGLFPARVAGRVKTDLQEIPSYLTMFQLLKLSLNVVSAHWE